MHGTTAHLIFFVLVLFTAITLSSNISAQADRHVLDVTSMDTSVDPCADFFAYSCGGWIKKNPIPPDQNFVERVLEAGG